MKKNDLTLEEAIKLYLDHYRLSGKLTEADLQQSWKAIMGNSIARHTSQIYLKKKVLIIHLDSSVLRNELSYAKEKIVSKVNEYFKKEVVKEVLLA
jgi:predicted nucleic acid-binding Zn ribbon protein